MMKLRFNTLRLIGTAALIFFGLCVLLLIVADVGYINVASMKEALTSPDIRHAFLLSIGTSFLATAISLAIAIPAAYAMSRYPFRGMIVLDLLVDLLIVMPVMVIGVSLLVVFKFGNDLAAISGPFQWFGLMLAKCGNFFIYNVSGLVLAQVFCAASYAVRTIKASFDDVDPRLENVAMTLGCGRWGAFRRITLPLARNGIMAGMVLTWASAFEVFGAAVLIAGAMRGRTEILPTAIYMEVSIGRLETALAISLIMIAVASFILVAMRLVSGRSLFGTGGAR